MHSEVGVCVCSSEGGVCVCVCSCGQLVQLLYHIQRTQYKSGLVVVTKHKLPWFSSSGGDGMQP